MRWLIAVAVAISAAWAGRCEACSCGPAEMVVFPESGGAVPTNARVWLRIPEAMRSSEQVRHRRYFIRAADGKDVPSNRVDVRAEGALWVVLTAKAPLAPDSRFEVMTTTTTKGAVAIGRFETDADADREAPSFPQVPVASAVRAPRRSTCSTGELYVEVAVGAPRELGTTGAVLYGIWPGDSRDPEKRPPLTYAVPHLGRLLLGRPGICSESTFKIPDPKRQSRLALVVRAIDLAGNLSPGKHLEVDLGHPAREGFPPSPPVSVSARAVAVEADRVTVTLRASNDSAADATVCLDPDQLVGLVLTDAKGAALQMVGRTIGGGPATCASPHRLGPSEQHVGDVTIGNLSAKTAAGGELTFSVPVTIAPSRRCVSEIAVDFLAQKIQSQQTSWRCDE